MKVVVNSLVRVHFLFTYIKNRRQILYVIIDHADAIGLLLILGVWVFEVT